MIVKLKNFTENALLLNQQETEGIIIDKSGRWISLMQGEDIIDIELERLKEFIKALKQIAE